MLTLPHPPCSQQLRHGWGVDLPIRPCYTPLMPPIDSKPTLRPSSTDGFLTTRIIPDPKWWESYIDLWSAYETWCVATGHRPDSKTMFSRKLGLLVHRPASNNAYRRWYGVRLLTPESA